MGRESPTITDTSGADPGGSFRRNNSLGGITMWKKLENLHAGMNGTHILDLFGTDVNRAANMSVRFDQMLFDYSKTLIDADVRTALVELAEEAGVESRRDAMFS